MGMMDERWATDEDMKLIERRQEMILKERQEKASKESEWEFQRAQKRERSESLKKR